MFNSPKEYFVKERRTLLNTGNQQEWNFLYGVDHVIYWEFTVYVNQMVTIAVI